MLGGSFHRSELRVFDDLRKKYLSDEGLCLYVIVTHNANKIDKVINRGLSRSGYSKKVDSDFRTSLRSASNASLTQWVPMHMTTESLIQGKMMYITSFTHPLYLAYLRKIGFTIFAYDAPDVDADVHVVDVYEILNYATLRFRIISDGFPNWDNCLSLIDSYPDERVATGSFVRETIMRWCKRNKLAYVGLGDEFESVNAALRIALNSVHVVTDSVYQKMKLEWPELPGGCYLGASPNNFIFNGNAIDYKCEKIRPLYVGLYSLSNKMNPPPRSVIESLLWQDKTFIVSFPLRQSHNMSPFCIERGPKGELFVDHTASAEDFTGLDVNVYSGTDLESLFTCDMYGNRHKDSGMYATSRCSKHLRRYIFVVSRYTWIDGLIKQPMFVDDIQTWIQSQTQWARAVSVWIRHRLNLVQDDIYELRYRVVKLLDPKARKPDDEAKRVTARLSSGKYVAVSGHLINLLLFAHVGNIDVLRYLRTVEQNIRISSGMTIHKHHSVFLENRLLGEDNDKSTVRFLWHSYVDFYYAVMTYYVMCIIFKESPNIKNILITLREIRRWKRQYPKFSSDSFEVETFLKEMQKGRGHAQDRRK